MESSSRATPVSANAVSHARLNAKRSARRCLRRMNGVSRGLLKPALLRRIPAPRLDRQLVRPTRGRRHDETSTSPPRGISALLGRISQQEHGELLASRRLPIAARRVRGGRDGAEDVGADCLEIHQAGPRNLTALSPFRDRRSSYFAELGDGSCPAERINYLVGRLIHGPRLGIPYLTVNRHSSLGDC